MFKYPAEIRTLIYTTNAIGNFNRQLRKVTKTKNTFVSDDALMKILYLATINITEKWTMPIRNWGTILDHLIIFFGDRVPVTLYSNTVTSDFTQIFTHCRTQLRLLQPLKPDVSLYG